MELFIFGWSLGLAAALVNHQVFVRPRIKSAVSELRSIRSGIEPVPVSERPWEREGWCDAEGKCWFYRPAEIPCRLANGTLRRWVLDTPYRDGDPVHDTHSLPHWALPVPGVEGADG
jgi:hypothetical protein